MCAKICSGQPHPGSSPGHPILIRLIACAAFAIFGCVGASASDDAGAFVRDGSELVLDHVYGGNPAVVFDSFLVTLSADHRYAFVRYMAGESGGQIVIRKTARGFVTLLGGGGQMTAGMIERFGVPKTDVARFLSPCPETQREPVPLPPDLRTRFSDHVRRGPHAGAPSTGVALCR